MHLTINLIWVYRFMLGCSAAFGRLNCTDYKIKNVTNLQFQHIFFPVKLHVELSSGSDISHKSCTIENPMLNQAATFMRILRLFLYMLRSAHIKQYMVIEVVGPDHK